MQSMFEWCTSLESIDLENLDMSHVTNAVLMFNGCTKLRGDRYELKKYK